MNPDKGKIKKAAYTIYAQVIGNKAVDMILQIAFDPQESTINNVLQEAENIQKTRKQFLNAGDLTQAEKCYEDKHGGINFKSR